MYIFIHTHLSHIHKGVPTLHTVYCPRRDCGFPAIIEPDDTLAVCCGCAYAFCVRCDRAWHGIDFWYGARDLCGNKYLVFCS